MAFHLSKKDEPVAGSQKWMLLLLVALVVRLGHSIATGYMDETKLDEIVYRSPVGVLLPVSEIALFLSGMTAILLAAAIQIPLMIQLWRASRMTGLCRGRRSFDTLAAAMKSQKYFFLLLGCSGILLAAYGTAMALATQGRLDTVKEWAQQARETRRAAAGQQP